MIRRTGTKAIRRGSVAAGAVTLALAAACSDGGGTSPDVSTVSSLVRFDTCDELSAWVAEEMVPHVGPYGLQEEWLTPMDVDTPRGGEIDGAPEPGSVIEDGAAPAPDMEVDSNVGAADAPMDAPSEAPVDAPADAPADAPDSDQTTYSETNVQVEGVDEPDILKTDGERIVAVADDTVHLASAETSQLLDSSDLPDGMNDPEMMLYGDRIVLFSSLRQQPGETAVAEVDIRGDTLSPSDTYVIEGDYVSARMIGSVVRLVTQSTPHDQFPFVSPASDTEEAREHAASVNRDLLADAGPSELLPGWRQVDDDGEALDEGDLFSCDQVHGPEDFAGFGTTSVVTFDVGDGVGAGITSSGGAGVLAEAETVYSSHEHLYVASHQFGEADSSDDGMDGIDGIDGDDIGGAGDIAPAPDPDEVGTAIHRFDISDPSEASYEVSGRVDGVLLNQFALDEHDGNLRVATTTGSPFATGDSQSESHVTVLEPTSDALVEVGSVSGLGEGETIHAVRFMGETGYVVTFQQVDPLYVIDLSDPSQPAETGELKILGYSAYLHPVGDGLLLGVGQDADETGRLEGTQVSLFDVSDPTDPQRVAQHTLDDATSAAEGEHRAFLWWEDTELAAIPASTWGSGGAGFEGLIGFTIDREGQQIEELGRVEHTDDATSGWRYDDVEDLSLDVDSDSAADNDSDSDDLSWDTPDPVRDDIAEPVTPAPEPSGSPILRSLVIGHELWTLSRDGLGHSDLETLDDTEVIPF